MARLTLPRITPGTYRRVTAGALALLYLIVVTGGAVRLTGSGLGCPNWPTCDDGRVVAPLEYHAMVEFVNRAITGLVSLGVVVAVLGSLVRSPRRRDLVVWSLGLVGGVAGQVVLGGLTVLFELRPELVMAHFLVSLVLLWDATVLLERAGQLEGPRRMAVPRATLLLGRTVVVVTMVAVFLGTVVTGSGPHGGDPDVARLGFDLRTVARVHGASVLVLLALVGLLLARHADRRKVVVLLGVLLAQAVVGYAQWFTELPVVLVGLHVGGAAAVWIAAVRMQLGMTTTAPASAPIPPPDPSRVLVAP